MAFVPLPMAVVPLPMALVGGGAILGVGCPLFAEANMDPRSPVRLPLLLLLEYPIPDNEFEVPMPSSDCEFPIDVLLLELPCGGFTIPTGLLLLKKPKLLMLGPELP